MPSNTAQPKNVAGSNAWPLQFFRPQSAAMRFTRTASGNSNDDGYLLVLLAEQERRHGRREQALSLLDAAYSAFDRTVIDD